EDVRHVRYAVERESTFTEKQSTHLRAGREQDSAHQTIVNAKRCDVSPLAKRRGDRISESVSQGFFQRALFLRHKKKTFFFRRVRIAILSERVLACKDLHPNRHEVNAIKNAGLKPGALVSLLRVENVLIQSTLPSRDSSHSSSTPGIPSSRWGSLLLHRPFARPCRGCRRTAQYQ